MISYNPGTHFNPPAVFKFLCQLPPQSERYSRFDVKKFRHMC